MKFLPALVLLIAGPALAADPKQEAAAEIKAAIDRDWVAAPGDFGSVVVTSPAYALPFNLGCVIHELAFLSAGGRASLGQMVATDRYYVFADGNACATADPAQFFSIEPGNDTLALLDFARTLKAGPRPGKDTISDADRMRILPCFKPDAPAATRIVRAHSWREKGNGRDDRYQVTLHCKALEDAGEIVAVGVRDQGAIAWSFKSRSEVTVDVPTPAGAGEP